MELEEGRGGQRPITEQRWPLPLSMEPPGPLPCPMQSFPDQENATLKAEKKSSCCDETGLAAPWESRDTGSRPRPAEWIKDRALPQLWLRSDPWTGNSVCCSEAKKKKKKKKKKKAIKQK